MSEPLHTGASARALAVFRIVFYTMMAQNILSHDLASLADMPREWFATRGIFRILPDEFYFWLLQDTQLLLVRLFALALTLLLILGVRGYHVWAALFCALFLLMQTLGKGFSATVNHTEMGMIFCSIAMILFPAADAWAVGPARPHFNRVPGVYGAALFSMASLFTLFYFLLGLRRFAQGGWEIFVNDAILGYLATRSLSYSTTAYEYGLLAIEYPWFGVLMKICFFVITLFELLSPLCLFHKKFRWVWLALMIPFHVSTLFTMNIFFKYNIVLIILLFTPACHLSDHLPWNRRTPTENG